jgi:DNA mismatch endonuclease (patch repair protein)
MPDKFSHQKRAEIISRVHSAHTVPEIRVRRLLHGLGYRYRLQRRDLPGHPDIVLPKYKTVIFVHGCFWHGCPTCRRATVRPANNAEYWNRKLDRTLIRDIENVKALEALGWRVMVIWECETRKTKQDILTKKLLALKYL